MKTQMPYTSAKTDISKNNNNSITTLAHTENTLSQCPHLPHFPHRTCTISLFLPHTYPSTKTHEMKKFSILISLLLLITLILAFSKDDEPAKPIYIPPSEQRPGDAAKGYDYLTTGDFLKSGVPYNLFIMKSGKDETNYLGRSGKNANVEQGYNVVRTADSIDIVIPTCLQCHAQVFEGKLVLGLGNSFKDFSHITEQKANNASIKFLQATAPRQYNAFKSFYRSYVTVNPYLETDIRGINPADKLAAVLVAHRDPQTLKWSDDPYLDIPTDVVPTDVPPWWLLRKKNAMFYNAFGRGDFGRFLMLSNLLTVADTTEANEVYSHFGDVFAYIRSLEPPKYTHPINKKLAAEGELIFMDNCRACHGTYGADAFYPNLIVPGCIIQTDSMLFKSNQQNKPFIDWFNKSWFAQGSNPAKLVPSDGYIAPPLDGIWITAPYFHNGSVPTIEAVLNSKLRPKYWSRDFENPEYDYQHLGWKYETKDKPEPKKTYNTTMPGYGNYGHYFGDHLSDKERKALIEYLKTL